MSLAARPLTASCAPGSADDGGGLTAGVNTLPKRDRNSGVDPDLQEVDMLVGREHENTPQVTS